ncbi:5219_t:CDS:2 [Funneliformis caledonium]|uniref:5219_t:CDS:1 n=1 Tax=Funneliformis caledonium TaxID=1117310 RepID=A0A9N9DXI6_9GLOM|nr:5219_t:CDS:2 [Funneliformis caledonium]
MFGKAHIGTFPGHKATTDDVLKEDKRSTNNCTFVVTVVDLMFNSNVQTTILSEELIIKRIKERKMTMQKDQEVF